MKFYGLIGQSSAYDCATPNNIAFRSWIVEQPSQPLWRVCKQNKIPFFIHSVEKCDIFYRAFQNKIRPNLNSERGFYSLPRLSPLLAGIPTKLFINVTTSELLLGNIDLVSRRVFEVWHKNTQFKHEQTYAIKRLSAFFRCDKPRGADPWVQLCSMDMTFPFIAFKKQSHIQSCLLIDDKLYKKNILLA